MKSTVQKVTFGMLKPGDKIWHTVNLKDFAHPEEVIIKSVDIDAYANNRFMEVTLCKFDSDTRLRKDTDYKFSARKDATVSDSFCTSKERAIEVMIDRWQTSVDEINEKISCLNNSKLAFEQLINNIKTANNYVQEV